MGKREKKSAEIKVRLLETTLQLLESREFEEVHVADICDITGISKVTFFKYFPQKEDIVFYYFRIWCLKQALILKRNERKGLQGLYFLVDEYAQAYLKYPGLFEAFVSNLVNLKFAIKPIPVSLEERKMLFPGESMISEVEIRPFQNMIEGFILEAILNKQITKFSDTVEMRNLVLALIHGLVVSAKLLQISEIRIQLRRAMDHLFASWR